MRPRNAVPALALATLLGLLAPLSPLGPAAPASAASAASAAAPDQATWEADVAAVMAGSQEYLEDRVADAGPGDRLAIVLDIDNTSLATHYAPGRPVRKVRNLARLADQLGLAVLFATGRTKSRLDGVRGRLETVGYDVSALCTRRRGESLVEGKQRCRERFTEAGYTLVANIGNRPTDFRGGGYERAYRLPDYAGELG